MTGIANTIRDEVAAKIAALTLPVPVTISTRVPASIKLTDIADTTRVYVNGGDFAFQRTARGKLGQAYFQQTTDVVVSVYRKVPTDDDGMLDASILDSLYELMESLADQLGGWFHAETDPSVKMLNNWAEMNDTGVFTSILILPVARDRNS